MTKKTNISKHYKVLPIVIILFVLNYVFNKDGNNYWTVNIIMTLVYITLLYIGVTRHRLNYFYNSVNKLSKNGLALTFDDGPNVEYTNKVLDILAKKNVKATFFIIGKNIKGNETILKRIDSEGHIIGNHSVNHSYWINSLPSKMIAKEIEENQDLIENVIGKRPRYYRTPFGLTSPNVARAIKKTKMISIGWDFRTFDTMAKDKNKLLEKLKKNAKSSSIMLLHDSNKLTV